MQTSHPVRPHAEARADDTSRRWLWTAASFVGALLLYLINIGGGTPHFDELYHVLAARGLLESGVPAIAEGVYERAYLHTWLVARFFDWFGDSLAVARLPSALAMAGTVTMLFVWLRRDAGLRAAVIGATLFAVSPFAVDTAQFVRFYGLQTVSFVAGSLLVYAALEHGPRGRWPKAGLGIALLALAVYFQMTSLIGIAGLLAWLTIRLGGGWVTSVPERLRARATLAALVVAGLAVAGLALALSGVLQPLWETYRHVPLFNRSNANNVVFYQFWYTLYYPTLWPAIAFIVVVSIASRPKPALFAAVLFVVALLLSTFAASKSLRYIIYVQPYAFALFGLAIAGVWAPLRGFLAALGERLAETLPLPRATARRLAGAALLASLAFLILGNSATVRTASLLADVAIPPEKKAVQWRLAAAELEPLLAERDVVVTMTELEMLYYFDRYDILLSASRLGEIPDGVDFSPDFRTGRPVIGSVAAMDKVLACFDSGVLVTNTRRWGDSDLISDDLMQLIERETEPVALPKSSRVLAFEWRHEDGTASPAADCDGLPARSG